MILLGLLLILVAAAVTVGAVYDGGDPATVEILGRELDTTVAGVFFTGAATMLLLLIGAWLFRASMGRARRKRAERKETRNRHRDSVSRLEEERTNLRAENERLAAQLKADKSSHGDDTTPGHSGTGATSGTSGSHSTDRTAVNEPVGHHDSGTTDHHAHDEKLGVPAGGDTRTTDSQGRHRDGP